MNKRLLIRADGSARIGAGHIMRCLSLAEAWRDRGGEVKWAAFDLPDPLRERLLPEQIEIIDLPSAAPDAFAALARSSGAGWRLVDHYGFDAPALAALRGAGAKLAVIDDMGALDSYPADLLINPNLFADEIDYAARAPEARLLLGPRYALLRRVFQVRAPRLYPEKAKTALIQLGGADPGNVTQDVLEALRQTALQLTAVVGPANPRAETLRQAFGDHVAFAVNVRDLGPLYQAADLIVTSGGSSVHEMARFAAPMLIGSLNPGEARLARRLAETGAAGDLGPFTSLRPETLAAQVAALATDAKRRETMGARAAALIDGQGAPRIVAAMLGGDGA